MLELEHPFKDEIAALRKIVMSVHPSVQEGIKWNAPSFRTSEYFATTNIRAKDGVGMIFHLGAKVREGGEVKIADPAGLLTWHAKDRASVNFRGLSEIQSNSGAFHAILSQWIAHV